jgi:hypothetical protein
MVSDGLANSNIATVTISVTSGPGPGWGYVYPLKRGANARLLYDQVGTPFFWSGDSAQSIFTQLNQSEVVTYLEDRKNRGVNIIVGNLIEHLFANNAPANYYRDSPFTGTPFQATPNEIYFDNVDYVINQAAIRGIIILLHPLYLGYSGTEQGWDSEVNSASISQMTAWGEYLGNRYKDYPNIIWSIGGDRDPTALMTKVNATVTGIRNYDTNHLFTTNQEPNGYAIDHWSPLPSWLKINNVYAYTDTIYINSKTAYDLSPNMPFFMMESTYENEHGGSAQLIRSEAYYPVLSGAIGYSFGNCPMWNFGAISAVGFCDNTSKKWQDALDDPASMQMTYVSNLFRYREWYNLVPDYGHTVMTAGYGTWGNPNYATAALTSNGNTMIAYLPTTRQVTINMSKMSGTQSIAYWYDPIKGTTTTIGTYNNSGTHDFTPSGNQDWVLVIDDSALGLNPPGNKVKMAPTLTLALVNGSTFNETNSIDK